MLRLISIDFKKEKRKKGISIVFNYLDRIMAE
jgi:hypothetical protein